VFAIYIFSSLKSIFYGRNSFITLNSLEDGITNFIHSFMNPPKVMVPVGYAYEIQNIADKVSMTQFPKMKSPKNINSTELERLMSIF